MKPSPTSPVTTQRKKISYIENWYVFIHKNIKSIYVIKLRVPIGFIPPPTLDMWNPKDRYYTFTYAGESELDIAAFCRLNNIEPKTQQQVSRWIKRGEEIGLPWLP